MLERQREGVAKAKAENRYTGRRPSARLKADEAAKILELSPSDFRSAKAKSP
jgi:DNA invertase Pin-like site-specific DNA recombinase